MRKIIVDVEDSGGVAVRIIGGHLNKRELLRVLKAIRLEYRRNVRMYRQNMTVKRHKEEARVAEVEAEEKAKAEAEAAKVEAIVKLGVKEDDRVTKENQ